MTDSFSTPEPTRRASLQWMLGLSLGSVVAPLAGCGGSASGATADTLPEPAALTSSGGQLSLDLFARYGAQPLRIAGSQPPAYPGVARTVQTALRSFNGQYMAPTLHLQPGDTLRIRLVNELPANVKGQSSLDYLNHQNSTNLHFHGLHVDPREIRPGVFGDYVVDMAEAGVLPGASRQHEVAIPADHTNGIYWYHPHLHGSSNVQVSSGMFGAILIHDPKDTFIDTPDIRERAIHVHKVNLTDEGKTESFYDSIRTASSGFLLNGAYQPTIVMRPGEVQQWHFVNTASFYPFNPVLDGHTLWAYAKDGNVFNRRFKPINAATSDQFDNAHWPGNALYPGNRHSIVVKASDVPGTYYLRSVKAPSSEAQDEIVARIVVEGTPLSTPLPQPARLPRYAEHLPITDEELAAHGGKQRSLVLAVLSKTSERLAQPIPAGEGWFIPLSDGVDGFTDTVFSSGDASPQARLSPFQSSLTATQTVALGAVEEWTIQNLNRYPHPFHIHVNDSYVVRVNGEPVDPYWADTLPVPPMGSITFRMRFTDFHGQFVWHCHALDHEDLGMMQLVHVVA
ncbi:multicopper oxidase domain-containing protein [Acidovorax sp. SUPP2539]|uniref:multicopper oxidase family protein n=1 Tax=Acidovorax sp. SUPP2539 TaxID=2920878 RepID=UPI0023DE5C23|nr:multicopper oxidase domain-containing protein [Acidovorax sp. SUPP2539]GKS90571.1 multicopper oxidase family protein [Acidovorax sp. SUPP2539]